MALYRVWLTVQDESGSTKEIDGGIVKLNTGFAGLTQEEIDYIEEALPLEHYLKKSEIDAELDKYATDQEVEDALHANKSICYTDFEFRA